MKTPSFSPNVARGNTRDSEGRIVAQGTYCCACQDNYEETLTGDYLEKFTECYGSVCTSHGGFKSFALGAC